jgi:hypothetical protein
MTISTKPTLPEVDELLALLPQPTVVDIGGVSVAIPVLTFGQVARIMAVLRPILVATPAARPLAEVVVGHLDTMLEILTIALGWPIERIEALPPECAARAFLALYEVNAEFFVRRAAALTPEVEKVAQRVGVTVSTFSSLMATATSMQ